MASGVQVIQRSDKYFDMKIEEGVFQTKKYRFGFTGFQDML